MKQRSHIQRSCKDAAFAARLSKLTETDQSSKTGKSQISSHLESFKYRKKIRGKQPRTWKCSICTLQNPKRKRKCEACGSVRHDSPAPVSPSARESSLSSFKIKGDDGNKLSREGITVTIRILSKWRSKVQRAEIKTINLGKLYTASELPNQHNNQYNSQCISMQ